jgi:flagellin
MPVSITPPYSALRALNVATADAAQASERISTGLKINRASDDPVGMIRANQLSVEIGSYTQVKSNLTAAAYIVEQAGDTLDSISDILASMQALALASVSATSSTVRDTYQTAFSSYLTDITTLASNTTVNGSSILDGTTSSVSIQVGIDSGDTKTLTFFNTGTGASGLALSSLDISTSSGASTAYTTLSTAIDTTDANIVAVAAYDSSIGYLSDFVDSMITNQSAEYSSIMTADLAEEATNLASAEIRQNSALAMVAQTNSLTKELVDFLLDSVVD